jgi:hypothetical protein
VGIIILIITGRYELMMMCCANMPCVSMPIDAITHKWSFAAEAKIYAKV